ncbi:hypothetical protein CW304_25800 [Bacillus sp. UFRGS-B20]|nr:hypothetical protein CW304_25800 [Bacillus sp. UFRGS-B20]
MIIERFQINWMRRRSQYIQMGSNWQGLLFTQSKECEEIETVRTYGGIFNHIGKEHQYVFT